MAFPNTMYAILMFQLQVLICLRPINCLPQPVEHPAGNDGDQNIVQRHTSANEWINDNIISEAMMENINFRDSLYEMATEMEDMKTGIEEMQKTIKYLSETTGCPYGWIKFDKSCYLFADQLANWTTASTICKELGADLVTVESERENKFLLSQIVRMNGAQKQKLNYFMGATDLENEGVFIWSKTNVPLSLTYTDWYPDRPNNWGGNQDCLAFTGLLFFNWDDQNCDLGGKFICEK